MSKLALAYIMLLLLSACTRPSTDGLLRSDNLPSYFFQINPLTDTILRAPGGVAIHIPKGAFTGDQSTTVNLEVKEALTMREILAGGLVTQTNGHPLSSGGMIYVNATGGILVHPITISIPTTFRVSGMRVYSGKQDASEHIDWVDPKPLQIDTVPPDVVRGERLFQSECASCHGIANRIVGPALTFVDIRRNNQWLRAFTRNNAQVIASGDKYACWIKKAYGGQNMNTFSTLSNRDIGDLYGYIESASQSFSPNSIPDPQKTFDSCVLYQRLKDSVERSVAGQSTNISLATDTSTDLRSATSTKEPPSYTFSITALGWHNVDILLSDLPGLQNSSLYVMVKNANQEDFQTYLVIPSIRMFASPSGIEKSVSAFTDGFTYLTCEGTLPLPQGVPAYVLALGEKDGKTFWAITAFTTSLRQMFYLYPRAMTVAEISRAIDSLDLPDVQLYGPGIPVRLPTLSRAMIQFLERLRPKGVKCDCNCLSKSDSTEEPVVFDAVKVNR